MQPSIAVDDNEDRPSRRTALPASSGPHTSPRPDPVAPSVVSTSSAPAYVPGGGGGGAQVMEPTGTASELEKIVADQERSGAQERARAMAKRNDESAEGSKLFSMALKEAEKTSAGLGVPEGWQRRPSSSPPYPGAPSSPHRTTPPDASLLSPTSNISPQTSGATGSSKDPSPATTGTGGAPTRRTDDTSAASPSQLSQASAPRYPASQGSPYYNSQAPSPPDDSRSPHSPHYDPNQAGGGPYAYHNAFYAPQYLYAPPAHDPHSLASIINPPPHQHSQQGYGGQQGQPYQQGMSSHMQSDHGPSRSPIAGGSQGAGGQGSYDYQGYYYQEGMASPSHSMGHGISYQASAQHQQMTPQGGMHGMYSGGMGQHDPGMVSPMQQQGWNEGPSSQQGSVSVGAGFPTGGYPFQSFQASGMPGSPYSASSGTSFGYNGAFQQPYDSFNPAGPRSREHSFAGSMYGYQQMMGVPEGQVYQQHPHQLPGYVVEGRQGTYMPNQTVISGRSQRASMGQGPDRRYSNVYPPQITGGPASPSLGPMQHVSGPGPGRPPSPGLASQMSGGPMAYGGGPSDGSLARGSMAQAKLHDGAYGRDIGPTAMRGTDPLARKGVAGTGPAAADSSRLLNRQGLPKPPAHSEWALWVGNVPNDSSHEELWRFFTTKPPPETSLSGEPTPAEIPVSSSGGPPPTNMAGVESIHLISRSNCAFVNYCSQRHLEHAIALCHGVPLRPMDPRCKPLVCRVRKKDDNVKSGVGAQRIGGMHRGWVEQQQRAAGMPPTDPSLLGIAGPGSLVGPSVRRTTEDLAKRFSTSTSHSASTSSTTSSFLTRHFPRRFFILKSHTEEDLELSVERSMWASQSHNEPVLDQAFRTCPDGVYLIFSANRSGEFFGYARMAGPIHKDERRISWASRTQGDSSGSGSGSGSGAHHSGSSGRPQPIQEEEGESESSQDPPPASNTLSVPGPAPGALLRSSSAVLSPSEGRLAESSPTPLTPEPIPSGATGPKAYTSEPNPFTKPPHTLSAPTKKAESLQPSKLAEATAGLTISDQPVIDQLRLGSNPSPAVNDDGVLRRDTAMTAEQRNAKLEQMDTSVVSWGRPFPITWISTQRLPFHRTRELRNPFNGSREVKISRDGTELEPTVGEALLAAFAAEAKAPGPPVQDASARSPTIGVTSPVLSAGTPSLRGATIP